MLVLCFIRPLAKVDRGGITQRMENFVHIFGRCTALRIQYGYFSFLDVLAAAGFFLGRKGVYVSVVAFHIR